MAVANDEWNGELTQFLDKLPARPCLVPPAPSFCSVCGSINAPVARPCRFYVLRHERERGQTFIELEPKRRADTFEIEVDFEEEEEDELPGAQMFEFGRPVTTTAIKGRIIPVAVQKTRMPLVAPKMEMPVEIEVYDAEVVEVVEEPKAGPAARPPEARPATDDEITKLAEAEAEARRLESELIEKQVRADREREQRQTEELERKVREDRERDLREQAELERRALDEMRAAEKAAKAPLPKPAEDQVLSKAEEERLEREIEEELAKAGLAPASAPAAPEEPPERQLPPDQVIAPIYSQPILKIIPPGGEAPKAGQPLPPPPPGYDAMKPAPAEKTPPETAEPPAPGLEPPATEPAGKPPEPEKPAQPEENAARPPAAPAPKEPAPALGQRRTGGLYGIFRKAPKDQPKPDTRTVDDELAKRLKKETK